jgi:hypothetical protein
VPSRPLDNNDREVGDNRALVDSLKRLEEYAKAGKYEGIDPYDALASPYIRSLPSPLLRSALTQVFVYSPINLRGLFKIGPGRNPKADALFASSYCNMYRAGLISQEALNGIGEGLSERLLASHIRGYHGYCWGIYFDLQDGRTTIDPRMPSIVPTSFAAHAFLDLYEITQDHGYLDLALSCCDFITGDLNILETEAGICFSYRPNDNKAIHNANLLGASILTRAHFHGGKREFLDLSQRAVDFSVEHQERDGSWSYSIDPKTGNKRFQIDYHQGFIIDSLGEFINNSNLHDIRYEDALRRGIDFYRNEQFEPSGRSLWRLPWRWPVDIHHQAQGITTFCKAWRHDPACLPFAYDIAAWTLEHMWDKSGYFYHQKYPVGTNKNSYMRWSQAWMMFALSLLLRCTTEAGEGKDLQKGV